MRIDRHRGFGGFPWLLLAAVVFGASPVAAQDSLAVRAVGDSVSMRFVDTDLRAVIQALSRYLDRPLVVGNVSSQAISFETPTPMPQARVPAMLRELVQAYGLRFVTDSVLYRIEPAQAPATRSGRPGQDESVPFELFVIRLHHARAADVAATVNQLFGGDGVFAGGGLTNGSLSDELRRDAQRALEPPLAAAPGAPGSPSPGQSAVLAAPVTIVPDELTNSLLVRATPADLAVIQSAVEQLDLRPLQVLIEVLVVEVRRDRAFALGLTARVEDADIGGGATLNGFLQGGGLGNFVLQVMGLGKYDIDLELQAAVQRGDAKIVSRPVVVASNNREARILVGSQQPFVQVSRSLPTETPTRDQVVQYRDVGTKLTVLPTINADGYVSLAIRQEVNAATNEIQFDAPVISTREAETQVLVRDGQTVVMGGLRERQQEVTKSGIPLLSELPVIGGLFGFEGRRTIETELFLFITPRVLRDDTEVDASAAHALDAAKETGVDLEKPKGRRP